MKPSPWTELRLPEANEDALWEVFHQNSKSSAFEVYPSNEQTLQLMAELWPSLPYAGYPKTELPAEPTALKMALDEAMRARITARTMEPCDLSLADLAALLELSHGVTRDEDASPFPRAFRITPSGGAMYPLEIYFHTSRVDGLRPGLYHYDPTARMVSLLHDGDLTRELSEALVMPTDATEAAMVVFITAMFERSTKKYKDRGYRFALIEAGHVAQNLNLAAVGLGLGTKNIGGYYDRKIDDVLGLDGLLHSTIYMTTIGRLVSSDFTAGMNAT